MFEHYPVWVKAFLLTVFLCTAFIIWHVMQPETRKAYFILRCSEHRTLDECKIDAKRLYPEVKKYDDL